MRRIAGIILLSCLIVPMAGSYVWLSVEKYRLKRTVRHTILKDVEKEQLELLVFHKLEQSEQLEWEHSTEFEYCGQMYDVVDMEERHDSVYYWCWPDRRETALNSQLQSLLNLLIQHKQHHTGSQVHWFDYFKLAFHPHSFSWNYQCMYAADQCYPPYIFMYPSISCHPPKPPPRPV